MVGILTLSPSGGIGQSIPEGFCFICGSRGLADAILNALLFLPLGVLLGKQGYHPVAALLLGAAMASGIEGLQMVVPGRHPTVGDIAVEQPVA